MQGMFLEARGETSKALKLYESVLALEKTNLVRYELTSFACYYSFR